MGTDTKVNGPMARQMVLVTIANKMVRTIVANFSSTKWTALAFASTPMAIKTKANGKMDPFSTNALCPRPSWRG